MDYGPLTYIGGCWKVDSIKIRRVVDASPYSPTIGRLRFGIPIETFRERVIKKEIPLHTGFTESMDMIADALGWKIDEVIETWEPLLSKSRREGPYGIIVEPNTTCGFIQKRIGLIKGEARIVLELYFIFKPIPEEDDVEPGDYVEIKGEPNITLTVKGGTTERGDLVTTARLVNLVPCVVKAEPGLLSVKDLPPTPPLPDIRYIAIP